MPLNFVGKFLKTLPSRNAAATHGQGQLSLQGTPLDSGDVDLMVHLFQSYVPGSTKDQAAACLARHGWNLQLCIAERTHEHNASSSDPAFQEPAEASVSSNLLPINAQESLNELGIPPQVADQLEEEVHAQAQTSSGTSHDGAQNSERQWSQGYLAESGIWLESDAGVGILSCKYGKSSWSWHKSGQTDMESADLHHDVKIAFDYPLLSEEFDGCIRGLSMAESRLETDTQWLGDLVHLETLIISGGDSDDSVRVAKLTKDLEERLAFCHTFKLELARIEPCLARDMLLYTDTGKWSFYLNVQKAYGRYYMDDIIVRPSVLGLLRELKDARSRIADPASVLSKEPSTPLCSGFLARERGKPFESRRSELESLVQIYKFILSSLSGDVQADDMAIFRGEGATVQVDVDERTVAFTGSFVTMRSRQRCPRGGKGYYELEVIELDDECPQYGFAATTFSRARDEDEGVGDDVHSWAVDGARQLKWHVSIDVYKNHTDFFAKAFRDLDLDCDRALSLDEFAPFAKANGAGEDKDILRLFNAFCRCDTDSNGVVSENAFLAFFLRKIGWAKGQRMVENFREHKSFREHNMDPYQCTWQAGDVIGLACDLDAMRIHVSVNGSFAAPNGVVFQLAPDAMLDGLFAAFSGKTGKVRYNLGEAPFRHAPPSVDYQAFAKFDVGKVSAVIAQMERLRKKQKKSVRRQFSVYFAQLSEITQKVTQDLERAREELHQYGDMFHLKEIPNHMMLLTALRELRIKYCIEMRHLPSSIENLTGLKVLDLQGCEMLKNLPSSITSLSVLSTLILKECKRLQKLPFSIGVMVSLRQLNLQKCESLKKLPKSVGTLARLEELFLGACKSLTQLPASIRALKNVHVLDLESCMSLQKITESIGSLTLLVTLDLSWCKQLLCLPETIGHLTGLQILNLQMCKILETLPRTIGLLTKLQMLDLRACERLKDLPEEVGVLPVLQTLDAGPLFHHCCKSLRSLPSKIGCAVSLQKISLQMCKNLVDLSFSFSELTALTILDIEGCKKLTKIPDSIGTCSNLRMLKLGGCKMIHELPSSIGRLRLLEVLDLEGCQNLEALPPSIGSLELLQTLNLSCTNLTMIPDSIGTLTSLVALHLQGCFKLEKIPQSINGLQHVRTLNLESTKLERLPNEIGVLSTIWTLNLQSCRNLVELPASIEMLVQLRTLDLRHCCRLRCLPEFTSPAPLTALEKLDLAFCDTLKELPVWIGKLQLLQSIDVHRCIALITPPQYIVRRGNFAVLQFMKDLADGFACCYEAKVVLLGDQRSGKSSLLDSLEQEEPATRADDDRTVGIDVRRVKKKNTVINFYDAAGHEVYQASHGLFMSADAMLLHIVRSNIFEQEAAVAALLSWIEVVNHEAPGAVMGVVWTHSDCVEVNQAGVLQTVQQKLERDNEALDEAMQALEDEAVQSSEDADKVSDHAGELYEEKLEKLILQWEQVRVHRDAELKILDRTSMIGCTKITRKGAEAEGSSGSLISITCPQGHQLKITSKGHQLKITSKFDSCNGTNCAKESAHAEVCCKECGYGLCSECVPVASAVQEMLDSIDHLKDFHKKMVALEAEIAKLTGQKSRDTTRESLRRLREQRTMRPRILFSHSMSSKTGDGLLAFKKALWNLIEDPRLFPHMGMKVPLNYSMLRELAARSQDAKGFTLFQGKLSNVTSSMRLVEFSDRSTMISRFKCPLGAKAYYEIEILTSSTVAMYGFATEDFERSSHRFGVGTNKHSWAFDGVKNCRWHNSSEDYWHNSSEEIELNWKAGDVVGLACDLDSADSMKIMVSVNGIFQHQHTFTIDRDAVTNGLFAAFSEGKEGKICYNLGEEPFKHKPPSEVFKAFVEYDVALPLCDLTSWEIAAAKRVEERCSESLRKVLASPYVSMDVLELACKEVGIYKKELDSALRFLHAIGSILHYGKNSDKSKFGRKVGNTVILQPQRVIDAIKCLIRESAEGELNDELRAMDAIIRRNESDKAELDKFLGLTASGAGILSKQLLTRHLWKAIPKKDHGLLLELLTGFKLLRPLTKPGSPSTTFLVPAMLSKGKLPLEFVEPWWNPPRMFNNAAGMQDVDGKIRVAAMRIRYTPLMGRLPFNFITDLQVSLSQSDLEAEEKYQHYSSEASVVDRLGGSVLSITYKCGGGNIREWVVISRSQQDLCDEQSPSSKFLSSDYINLMGWAELKSSQGTTDWRLLRHVVEEIKLAEKRTASLHLRTMLVFVDAQNRRSLDTQRPSKKKELITFEFEDHSEELVDVNIVSPGLETTLVVRAQNSSGEARMMSLKKQIEAFISNIDREIDVHQEGQILLRIISEQDTGWDFVPHPKPTIGDLFFSIAHARQRNLRLCHLAGHGNKKIGFIWNESDSATAGQEFEPVLIAQKLGAISGADGPLDGVFLNACSTYNFGKLLIDHGVRFVVCWKTEVQDETARELARHFYRALVEKKEHAMSVEDYQNAFVKATNILRASAYTKGFPNPMPTDSPAPSATVDTTRNSPSGDAVQDPIVSTESPNGTRKKVVVETVSRWQSQDVVVFLSQQGETEPIYLWREHLHAERPFPFETDLKILFEKHELDVDLCASLCKELGVKRVCDMKDLRIGDLERLPWLGDTDKIVFKRRLARMIEGFDASTIAPTEIQTVKLSQDVFSKKRIYAFQAKQPGDAINVHGEFQRVYMKVRLQCDQFFQFDNLPLTTFDDFKSLMLDCVEKRVVGVWFSGHAGEGGKLCFAKDHEGSGMEMLGPDIVAPPVGRASRGSTPADGKGVEFVLLNSCHTRPLGIQMRKAGVPHVVCWRGGVDDHIAFKFAEWFFRELSRDPSSYRNAFDAGMEEVKRIQESCAGDLSFLSENQADEVDPIHDEEGSAEARFRPCYSGDGVGHDVQVDVQADAGDQQKRVDRMANNVKGFHELQGLKELGFNVAHIQKGVEAYQNASGVNSVNMKWLAKCGLEESALDLYEGKTKVAGKKMLFIKDQKVLSFTNGEACNYLDLWRKDGAVENKIEHSSSEALTRAKWSFEQSLSVRKSQCRGQASDASHQAMIDGLTRCIDKIITVTNKAGGTTALGGSGVAMLGSSSALGGSTLPLGASVEQKTKLSKGAIKKKKKKERAKQAAQGLVGHESDSESDTTALGGPGKKGDSEESDDGSDFDDDDFDEFDY